MASLLIAMVQRSPSPPVSASGKIWRRGMSWLLSFFVVPSWW
jgi:hypothetical protein